MNLLAAVFTQLYVHTLVTPQAQASTARTAYVAAFLVSCAMSPCARASTTPVAQVGLRAPQKAALARQKLS